MPLKPRRLGSDSREIPVCTLRRALIYVRALGAMNKRDNQVVSSEELANFLCLTGTTVRRDLSAFGKLGTRGVGYQVGDLRARLLELAHPTDIVLGTLVGVGRLGGALLGHGGLLGVPGLLVSAAFDVDVRKIGSAMANVRILDASRMVDTVRREGITLGIVTVPAEAAQGVVDKLVEGGVSAILNFAPVHITASPSIMVSNIDISLELESLLLSLSQMSGEKHSKTGVRTGVSSG